MGIDVTATEREELLTSLAVLILHDDKAPITEENINKLLVASGAEIEGYWPKLFADLLEGKDISDLILNAGAGAAAAPGGAAGGAAPAASGAAAAAKEPEPEEEGGSGDDMGFSLFD